MENITQVREVRNNGNLIVVTVNTDFQIYLTKSEPLRHWKEYKHGKEPYVCTETYYTAINGFCFGGLEYECSRLDNGVGMKVDVDRLLPWSDKGIEAAIDGCIQKYLVYRRSKDESCVETAIAACKKREQEYMKSKEMLKQVQEKQSKFISAYERLVAKSEQNLQNEERNLQLLKSRMKEKYDGAAGE